MEDGEVVVLEVEGCFGFCGCGWGRGRKEFSEEVTGWHGCSATDLFKEKVSKRM